MNHRPTKKGTVPCHTWRMLRGLEEEQDMKRPAVPGRRSPIHAADAPAAAPVQAPEVKKTEAKKTDTKKTETKKTETKKSKAKKTEAPFDQRLALLGGELERLYREQFQGDLAAWDGLLTLLRESSENREAALTALDQRRAADPDWYGRRDLLGMAADAAAFAGSVTGVEAQLDYLKECGVGLLRLSCAAGTDVAALAAACRSHELCLALELTAAAPRDAAAFYAWTAQLLALANQGADVICLGDAAAYPQPVLRMARLVCELACPGVLLMAKAAPWDQASGFGADGKPACHLLCRSQGALLFHTLATGDTALLRRDLDQTAGLAKAHRFLNRLRTEDGFAWDLDYGWLKEHCASSEDGHRQYLNDWITGRFPGSNCRGQLCRDGKVCGTTASLCGVEAADYERNSIKLERTIACDLLLHAFLLTQSGLPMVLSGDEVGQLNDYTYQQDPARAGDARNLHRGSFQWELAGLRGDGETRQGKQFQGLRRLTELRAAEPAFDPRADVWTFDAGDARVLGLGRWYEGRKLVALFNFSGDFVTASAPEGGAFEELIYGGHYDSLGHVELYPYGFVWLLQR